VVSPFVSVGAGFIAESAKDLAVTWGQVFSTKMCVFVSWQREKEKCLQHGECQSPGVYDYGVAAISRLLKIIGPFCRISSFL